VGFISLGCPKNLVDSVVLMGLLDRAGARLTAHPEEADWLLLSRNGMNAWPGLGRRSL
jgi:ribosomal protein S12 methylthiotransferase